MIPGVFASAATIQGPRLWTPAYLSAQPKVWVDWDSNIAESSGDAAEWGNERGALGGVFSQGTPFRRPAIVVGPNGRRSLHFDGDDDYMAMTGAGNLFRNVGAGWAFSVIKAELDTGDTIDARGPANAARFTISYGSTGNTAINTRRLDSDPTTSTVTPGTPGEWGINYHEANWAAGTRRIVINGVEATSGLMPSSGNTSDTPANLDYLGLYNRPASLGSNYLEAVSAAHIIGSGSLPSGGELQRLEGWAAWQCGLQDKLPVGHPYKDEPPTA